MWSNVWRRRLLLKKIRQKRDPLWLNLLVLSLFFYFFKTQPSFFQFISAITSLIPVFFFNSVLQSWGAKSFLRQKMFCGRIFTSSFDIQTWISWASDIEIKQLKNPNSSTHVGLQLSWRIRGEIKSFYRTESSRNLVGKKWSPDMIQNWLMSSIPIWLRV